LEVCFQGAGNLYQVYSSWTLDYDGKRGSDIGLFILTQKNTKFAYKISYNSSLHYEALTHQIKWCVHVGHVSNINTCTTLTPHMSDTLESCQILRKQKVVCLSCVSF